MDISSRIAPVFLIVVFLIAVMVSLAVATAAPAFSRDWRTTLLGDHPLVGAAWDAKAGKPAALEDVVQRARRANFLILGEKHDSPDHHLLQAEIIAALDGRSGTVLFEMANDAHADTLANATVDGLDTLGEALEWEERGWPDWAMYRPVFQAALETGFALAPADVERAERKRIGRGGFGELADDRRRHLALDRPLAPALEEDLRDEVFASHCEMVPREHLSPMVNVQRFRDAVMAANMRAARGGGEDDGEIAVLIAGAGHGRADRGVPHALREQGVSGEGILSVAFYEVVAGEEDAGAYVPRDPSGAAAVDYILFTPRVDDIDPCEAFREQLESMRDGG